MLLRTFFLTFVLIMTHTAVADPSAELASYEGRVVYLDFWASWCGPYQLSFPFMQSLVDEYPASEFAVVTVNLDRRKALADKFLKDIGGRSLPVIMDPQGEWAEKFAVQDMPYSVLIDKRGNVRFEHAGFHETETSKYRAHIEQLLAEKE